MRHTPLHYAATIVIITAMLLLPCLVWEALIDIIRRHYTPSTDISTSATPSLFAATHTDASPLTYARQQALEAGAPAA